MAASEVKVSKMNFELNPRGNLWFNDETTFGHKLLSKMGWSKGKGLGKNEDGIKENIRISKKDSNSGVGWKREEIPIAVGCLEYENILQNLQKHFKNKQESTSEKFEKSLEQRSRSARNHLHYQKFVRGKDLIRYSDKDMKSIFLEKPPKPVSEHPNRPPQTPTFNSQLSVNDYFAMKLQKKKEEAAKSVSSVTPQSNRPSQSQQSSENFSKKRKCVTENPESETSRKAKFQKKDTRGETSSASIDAELDKSSKPEKSCKRKKTKKSEKNKSRLQQLKSCLKSRTNYNLETSKNVSFSESVSYKILDTSLELSEEINDTDHMTDGLPPSLVEVPLLLDASSEEPETTNQCNDSVLLEENELRHGAECATSEPSPQCFDLPTSSGSNFNFWLESQRQATKMKLYKDMVKKIKKNKMLRYTNLLDIKGYGNWGL